MLFVRFGFLIMLITFSLEYPLTPSANIDRDPEEIGGFFEGDMILDDLQIAALNNPITDRNGLIDVKYRWPGNTVFYEISKDFDAGHHDYILKAMLMIQSVSCLRFLPKETSPLTKDFIQITAKNIGCNSVVGRRGGMQRLNLQIYPLDVGCFRLGSIVHEFLHALGFHHQQSSYNRDDYVTIVLDNIEKEMAHNFDAYSNLVVTDFGVPYDYGSVMHYGSTAFSKNGGKTIIPKDPEAVIGQRKKISDPDIIKLNRMYNCPRYAYPSNRQS